MRAGDRKQGIYNWGMYDAHAMLDSFYFHKSLQKTWKITIINLTGKPSRANTNQNLVLLAKKK